MMLRVLIVDDEPLARSRLRRQLVSIPDVEIVGECNDGASMRAALQDRSIDVVFLDVQMPELNGFEALEHIAPDARPLVVFVTAYEQFALRAFDVHALDYVLKPTSAERVARSVERARAVLSGGPDGSRLVALLHSVQHEQIELRKTLTAADQRLHLLAVDVGRRTFLLPLADADWIEADDNYIRLHVQGKCYTHRMTLSELEQRLDPRRFVRIHRSAVVNVERIREITRNTSGDASATLRDGSVVRISRTYRPRLEALVGRS
jgi:two-component system LytT family response regulator